MNPPGQSRIDGLERERALLKEGVIWVTWERQLRNYSMTSELGVPLFTIYSRQPRAIRYLLSATRTLEVLWRQRPRVVVCQNPSIVLTVLLLAWRRILRFKLAVDAHYGGIAPWTGNTLIQRVLDLINRAADLVIVTNEAHANHVRALGGRAFVCPDPLPDLSRYPQTEPPVKRKLLLICSFDADEPYREALSAASVLTADGFQLFVSGNFRRAGLDPRKFPQAQFLGFVPEEEYYRHLFSSEVVIDLTRVDNCLVCGAYEAMAACKPVVLSRKQALEEYFSGGTVFTENRGPAIARAVKKAHANSRRLKSDLRQWVREATEQTKDRMCQLMDTLDSL